VITRDSPTAPCASSCSGVFRRPGGGKQLRRCRREKNRGLAVGLYATSYYIGGSVGGALPALLLEPGRLAGVRDTDYRRADSHRRTRVVLWG